MTDCRENWRWPQESNLSVIVIVRFQFWQLSTSCGLRWRLVQQADMICATKLAILWHRTIPIVKPIPGSLLWNLVLTSIYVPNAGSNHRDSKAEWFLFNNLWFKMQQSLSLLVWPSAYSGHCMQCEVNDIFLWCSAYRFFNDWSIPILKCLKLEKSGIKSVHS